MEESITSTTATTLDSHMSLHKSILPLAISESDGIHWAKVISISKYQE